MAKKGEKLSEERKRQISLDTKRGMNNKELREKLSKAHLGKKMTEESKRKISKKMTKFYEKNDHCSKGKVSPKKNKGKWHMDSNGYKKMNIDGKRVLESHHVFCKYTKRSSIPYGFVIHHKDRNKLNNNIENLQLLSRSSHTKLHWSEEK